MFEARKAQKKVSILESVITPDGFGGNTTENTVVSVRWAIIDDMGGNAYQTEAGVTDFANTFKITLRYDKNLIIEPKKHTLKYGEHTFSILDAKRKGFRQVQQILTAKEIFGIE